MNKAILAGEGNYNCVYEIGGSQPPTVARISVMPDKNEDVLRRLDRGSRNWFLAMRGDPYDETFSLLYRGQHLVPLLNRYRKAFGPSFVQDIGRTKTLSGPSPLGDLGKMYDITLCEKLMERVARYTGRYSLVLQYMEKLGPSWTGTSAEEIFALIWFFATTQRSLLFLHHDLKGANLLTRKYQQAQKFGFIFEVEQRQLMWEFVASSLPVVIDFDFGTVRGTQFETDRDRLGTYTHAPPDAICRDFLTMVDETNGNNIFASLGFDEGKKREFYEFGPADENGYDMWSIGMILLYNVWGIEEMEALQLMLVRAANAFVSGIIKSLQGGRWNTPPSETLNYLFCNTIISCVVLEGSSRFPALWEREGYGFRYPKWFFGTKRFDEILVPNREIPLSMAVDRFRQIFHQNDVLFAKHRPLIQYLMGWDPQERGTQGSVLVEFSRPGQLFAPLVVQKGISKEANQTFRYNDTLMETQEGADILDSNDREQLQMKI